MILGRRYSRLKRRMNCSAVVKLTHRKTGAERQAPRKFAMLYILGAFEGMATINKKALKREYDKFINQLESKEE